MSNLLWLSVTHNPLLRCFSDFKVLKS